MDSIVSPRLARNRVPLPQNLFLFVFSQSEPGQGSPSCPAISRPPFPTLRYSQAEAWPVRWRWGQVQLQRLKSEKILPTCLSVSHYYNLHDWRVQTIFEKTSSQVDPVKRFFFSFRAKVDLGTMMDKGCSTLHNSAELPNCSPIICCVSCSGLPTW